MQTVKKRPFQTGKCSKWPKTNIDGLVLNADGLNINIVTLFYFILFIYFSR